MSGEPQNGRGRGRTATGRTLPPTFHRSFGEAGEALVEGAITLPVLLLVAVALVQFALFAHARHVMAAAAQEGARVAAAEDQTLADGVAHARALLEAGLGHTATAVSVHAWDDGQAITTTATGQLRLVIPWVADASLPLSAQAVVSKERFRAGGLVP